jgi:hypothetical protein
MAPYASFADRWLDRDITDSQAALTSVARVSIRGLDVGIVLLNSAWRSSKGFDRNRLYVPEEEVVSAFASLEDTEFVVVAMHHPLSWLEEGNGQSLDLWIQRKAHLVLTGHTHVIDPSYRITLQGSTVTSAAGCLYERIDYRNAFSIIDVSFSDHTFSTGIFLHGFNKGRGFSLATDLGDNGRFALNDLPLESFLPAALAGISAVEIRRHLVEVAERQSITPRFLAERRPARITEVFVEPVFLPAPYGQLAKELAGDRYELEYTRPLDLVKESGRVAICGGSESGVTGALLWALDNLPAPFSSRVPVYLDASDLGRGPALVENAARHALMDAGVELGARDDLPPLVVAIDDLQDLTGRQGEQIGAFFESHPEHWLIAGWHDDRGRVGDLMLGSDREHFPVERCFLGPMGPPQLRKMVAKLLPDADQAVVERILSVIASENLPRNPFVMSLLVVLLGEQVAQLETVSETSLLDRYVEHLLDQAAGAVSSRIGLDPANWSMMLEGLAYEFRKRRQRFLQRLEVDAFFVEYFRSHGWRQSPLPVIEQLLEWRLLVERSDQVGFWHPALLDLFLGRLIDSEFSSAEWDDEDSYVQMALTDPLKHRRPVEHAAFLGRGNRILLSRIADFNETVFGRSPELEAATLPRWGLIEEGEGVSNVEALETQVRIEVPTPEERQRRRDEAWARWEAEHADDPEREDFEDEAEMDLIDELLQTARIFSTVLRGSERLEDLDLKSQLLQRAVRQWGQIAILLAVEERVHGSIREHLRERIEEESPAKSKQESEQREILAHRVVNAFFGSFVQAMMATSLGTRKLDGILAEVLDADAFFENVPCALFGTLLFGELESDQGSEWLNYCEKLFARHRQYMFVNDLLYIFLQRKYHFGPVREADRTRLANLIVEAVLDLNGITGSEGRSRGRINILQGLRQKALLESTKELKPDEAR